MIISYHCLVKYVLKRKLGASDCFCFSHILAKFLASVFPKRDWNCSKGMYVFITFTGIKFCKNLLSRFQVVSCIHVNRGLNKHSLGVWMHLQRIEEQAQPSQMLHTHTHTNYNPLFQFWLIELIRNLQLTNWTCELVIKNFVAYLLLSGPLSHLVFQCQAKSKSPVSFKAWNWLSKGMSNLKITFQSSIGQSKTLLKLKQNWCSIVLHNTGTYFKLHHASLCIWCISHDNRHFSDCCCSSLP
jgi:hypothetical protein